VPSGPWIEARGVHAGYRERAVLHDVSLEARRGELVSVLGPNGAGKSTLVRVLAGTLEPTAGAVWLAGKPAARLKRRDIARLLAVVPQETEVAFGFNVEQVVMMGRAPHQSGLLLPGSSDRGKVRLALERCELVDLAQRPVSELSGGERRRVVIARALAQEPEVLVLDEPAAHLDIRHAVALYEMARREVRERQLACVAVMHDLNAAARWSDRVILMKDGRIRASGSVEAVLEPGLLAEVFGLALRVGTDPVDGARYFLPASTSASAQGSGPTI
jgi:iron complex transport system ATP-binding protein